MIYNTYAYYILYNYLGSYGASLLHGYVSGTCSTCMSQSLPDSLCPVSAAATRQVANRTTIARAAEELWRNSWRLTQPAGRELSWLA